MAVTFVGASAIAPVAGSFVQVTLPTLQANDIIVLGVMSKNLTVPTNEIDTPTGYTEVGTKVSCDAATNANDMRSALFWKRASASDSGAAVEVTRAGAGTQLMIAAAFVYRGCVTTGSPFDTVGIATDFDIADDSDAEFPALNPDSTACRVCYLYIFGNDTPGANMPASFTNGGFTFGKDAALTTAVGNDASIGIYSGDTNGAALNAVSATATSGTGSDISYAFALLPAGTSITLTPTAAALRWIGYAPVISTEFLATTMTLELRESGELRASRPLEPFVVGEQHPGWEMELTSAEADNVGNWDDVEIWLVADGGVRGILVTYAEILDANTTEAGGDTAFAAASSGFVRRYRVLGPRSDRVHRFGFHEVEDL